MLTGMGLFDQNMKSMQEKICYPEAPCESIYLFVLRTVVPLG